MALTDPHLFVLCRAVLGDTEEVGSSFHPGDGVRLTAPFWRDLRSTLEGQGHLVPIRRSPSLEEGYMVHLNYPTRFPLALEKTVGATHTLCLGFE